MADTTDTPATHRYVGNHAAEINGVMRGPGEFVSLTKEQLDDSSIKDYIDNGNLIDLKGGEKVNG